MIQWMLTIWSLVPLLFLIQLEHLEVHSSRMLKAGLENFEHYFTSVWDECNCAVVWTSLVAQTVKRLPIMWNTQAQSLSREDLQEKEMATHSSILACKILWMEEPGRPTVHGVAKSWTWLSDFTYLSIFGIAFLWDWNENWPFPVLWPLMSLPNLLAYWVWHFHSIIC